jgi:proteic killer suppression protein
MIKSFRHKGLRRFLEDDGGGNLPPDMPARTGLIPSTLHATQEIEGVNVPAFRSHILRESA